MVVKSHRQLRHEREHNELADWLAERLEVAKPYTAQIAIGAIVIVVAIGAGVYYFGTERQVAAQDWAEYFNALNEREPEKGLKSLYDNNPTSPAGLWAAQTLGDINLAQGAALMFSDRTQAKEKLEAAKEYYKTAEAAPNDLNLVARARLGLGKVYESQCRPKDAMKYYQLVADTQKDSAIGKVAAKAAKRMENPREVSLLAWFDEQTPKKPAPLPGEGGGLPGLPNDLPDRPNISPPSGLGLDNFGKGLPETTEPTLPLPGATTPAPSATNPEEAKPGETKPASEPPAATPAAPEAKPAADKPAESKPAESKPE